MTGLEKYKLYEYKLIEVGDVFRRADKEFQSFTMEDKRMLNDVGKIISEMARMLVIYRYIPYVDEERKLRIRRIFADLEKYVEGLVKEVSR